MEDAYFTILSQLQHGLLSAIMVRVVENSIPPLIRYQENEVEFRLRFSTVAGIHRISAACGFRRRDIRRTDQ